VPVKLPMLLPIPNALAFGVPEPEANELFPIKPDPVKPEPVP